jgi:signal transduction histidine kinase
MSPAEIERLTRAYARGGDSTGFGLGLSIVQRLARALDAEIDVSSAPSEGTTFRVRVPHAPPS